MYSTLKTQKSSKLKIQTEDSKVFHDQDSNRFHKGWILSVEPF